MKVFLMEINGNIWGKVTKKKRQKTNFFVKEKNTFCTINKMTMFLLTNFVTMKIKMIFICLVNSL